MQKCWPRPNASTRRMGRSQMNSSGSRVLPLVAVGRSEQGDDPLARLDGLVVNGVRPPGCSGEPLGRRAIADHLLARDRDVRGGVGAHRGHLIGALAELPQPVGDDLGHRLRSTDEDAQHLGRDLGVGQRAAVGQPVAQQAVDNRQRIPGCVGPAALDHRYEVFEVVGPRLRGVDALAGLGQAAGVDRGQHLRREIVWQAQ